MSNPAIREDRAEEFMRSHDERYDENREHYSYSLPSAGLLFDSMADLRQEVTDSGSHFFDRDTMKFFNSRVGSALYGDRFFITAERKDPEDPERYTVRYFYRAPGVDALQHGTIGEFMEHEDMDSARAVAKEAARVL